MDLFADTRYQTCLRILEMPCRRLHRLPYEPMCDPPVYSTKVTNPVFWDYYQKILIEFRPTWAECKVKLRG